MSDFASVSRRQFVQGAAALMASTPLLTSTLAATAADSAASSGGNDSADGYLYGRLYKTLKIGMVNVPGSLTDKFKAAKAAGFHGIELNAPGFDVTEVREAMAAAEFPVDGTVCSSHWQIRHTSPDANERAQALETLKEAMRKTHAIGGNTVLLVVGHGKDGPEQEIWKRSIDNINQALPLAAELGIYIAIENVWNEFLYDHQGGADQTAEKFVKFVDELNSPWVSMQFYLGNHWKYGSMGDWIRQLNRRIVKLDLKGFSRKDNKFTKIGEGDLDWADVRKALKEIQYTGWAAAEVGGGGPDRLAEISANMDKVFALHP
ncbi:MAG: sugar phosphate isomerase/epimerase [Planctomycetales bacterium]|nr:sugar phosphate isomerase/epimerase [Planctomycetales bacterium]